MRNLRPQESISYKSLTARDLESGTVDISIHLYRGDSAYEVKFLTDAGQTIALKTVDTIDLQT